MHHTAIFVILQDNNYVLSVRVALYRSEMYTTTNNKIIMSSTKPIIPNTLSGTMSKGDRR